MARAIIRWSVNGEGSNQTGNAITKELEANGFGKIGTAAYEAEDAPLPTILTGIRQALDRLENPPGGGSLDHVWIYVDTPDEG